MYTGGTPEAIQFIEKYKETGHVVYYQHTFYGIGKQSYAIDNLCASWCHSDDIVIAQHR